MPDRPAQQRKSTMFKTFSAKASKLALVVVLGAVSVGAAFDAANAAAAAGGRGGNGGGSGGSSGSAGAGARDTVEEQVLPCAASTCGHPRPQIRFVWQPPNRVCHNGFTWAQDIDGLWVRATCDPSQHGYDTFE
jgi:hypothetical protein